MYADHTHIQSTSNLRKQASVTKVLLFIPRRKKNTANKLRPNAFFCILETIHFLWIENAHVDLFTNGLNDMALFSIYEKKYKQNKWAHVLIRLKPFSVLSHLHLCLSRCHSLCLWALRQPHLEREFWVRVCDFLRTTENCLCVLILVSSGFYQKMSKKGFFDKNTGLSTLVLKWFATKTRRGHRNQLH